MDKNQISNVKHALNNGNRFYIEALNPSWMDLVEKGFTVKRPGWEDDMAYFIVTDEGKKEFELLTNQNL